ncbi:hypothetical protein ElyMa_000714700 [Elysia marginata]|uniref:Uncharacterized protein n=1 Tax=Elysia marginata TaxID=1093978 RepID=A0AAV4GKC4_9GAST|nr:hypothetical protein ElyMa_000714700 [Elysia marginata]
MPMTCLIEPATAHTVLAQGQQGLTIWTHITVAGVQSHCAGKKKACQQYERQISGIINIDTAAPEVRFTSHRMDTHRQIACTTGVTALLKIEFYGGCL